MSWVSSRGSDALSMLDTVTQQRETAPMPLGNPDEIISKYGRPMAPRYKHRASKPTHQMTTEEKREHTKAMQSAASARHEQMLALRHKREIIAEEKRLAAAEKQREAEAAAAKRLEQANRAKQLELEHLAATKVDREREAAEQKRVAADAERISEERRLKRLEEQNKATELTIKALEAQRILQEREAEQKRLEEERKLVEARNKSVELDLQIQSIDDWKLECAVCLAAPSRYAVIPCGHYVLCSTCSKEYEEDGDDDGDDDDDGREPRYKGVCPMCRQEVRGLLQIFIATASE